MIDITVAIRTYVYVYMYADLYVVCIRNVETERVWKVKVRRNRALECPSRRADDRTVSSSPKAVQRPAVRTSRVSYRLSDTARETQGERKKRYKRGMRDGETYGSE